MTPKAHRSSKYVCFLLLGGEGFKCPYFEVELLERYCSRPPGLNSIGYYHYIVVLKFLITREGLDVLNSPSDQYDMLVAEMARLDALIYGCSTVVLICFTCPVDNRRDSYVTGSS